MAAARPAGDSWRPATSPGGFSKGRNCDIFMVDFWGVDQKNGGFDDSNGIFIWKMGYFMGMNRPFNVNYPLAILAILTTICYGRNHPKLIDTYHRTQWCPSESHSRRFGRCFFSGVLVFFSRGCQVSFLLFVFCWNPNSRISSVGETLGSRWPAMRRRCRFVLCFYKMQVLVT